MNILLTSVGRRTYMIEYFKNALKGNGFVFAANSDLTYSLKQADEYIITPEIYNDNYIDFLLEYCKKKSINAIISLFDIDLPVLSRNNSKFEQNGIKLLVSSENVVDICNDKWKTYQFFSSINLLQPKTYINFEECIDGFKKEEIFFPVIIKPRWGMGSIGIYEADTIDELKVLFKKTKNTILNTYIKYESKHDLDSSIIIQQKIIGNEYGLDILNDLNGNYITTAAKRKLAMRAGETDIAQSCDNSFFIGISKKISNSLKYICNLDVDCIVTDNKEIFIIEMNCRFGGQYPFSHLSGVNYPMQIINWLNNNPTDYKLLNYKNDIIACKEILPVILSSVCS
jgi:carbamoyl-phosphate synthase large subunit